MAKEKTEKMNDNFCEDRLCPIHGKNKLKTRGRVFEGTVIRKLPNKITIEMERMFKIPKYERYEKRRTKIHARYSPCMKDMFEIGDLVEVSETRPISKTINFVLTKIMKRSKIQ